MAVSEMKCVMNNNSFPPGFPPLLDSHIFDSGRTVMHMCFKVEDKALLLLENVSPIVFLFHTYVTDVT